jgi:hypothetical protein
VAVVALIRSSRPYGASYGPAASGPRPHSVHLAESTRIRPQPTPRQGPHSSPDNSANRVNSQGPEVIAVGAGTLVVPGYPDQAPLSTQSADPLDHLEARPTRMLDHHHLTESRTSPRRSVEDDPIT